MKIENPMVRLKMVIDAVKNEYIPDYNHSANGWHIGIDHEYVTLKYGEFWAFIPMDGIEVYESDNSDIHISNTDKVGTAFMTITASDLGLLV